MNIGSNGSWIEVTNWIPGRKTYMYWDKSPYYADAKFIKRKIRVRFKKFEFTHPELPFIACFLSCKNKDSTKVEEGLEDLNKRLLILDSNYQNWIEKWQKELLTKLK